MQKETETRKQYLERLCVEDGYDSLRISLNPTKEITEEGLVEDMISFFEAKKTGKGITHIFTVK